MAYYWIPPPLGVIKINVHGTSSKNTSANGFRTGIGAVYRNFDGVLKNLTIGVIPELSPLGNQLWAIFVSLKRVFKIGFRDDILGTNNVEAFNVIKNYHIGAPARVFDIATQINIRLKDNRWFCIIAYMVSARNRVARFLSRLGRRVCCILYTLNRPVGGIEELLDWDIDMGLDDPSPKDFNDGMLLSDQTHELGLGQVNAPNIVAFDIERDANNDLEEAMMEEAFQGGIAAVDGYIFAGDISMVTC